MKWDTKRTAVSEPGTKRTTTLPHTQSFAYGRQLRKATAFYNFFFLVVEHERMMQRPL